MTLQLLLFIVLALVAIVSAIGMLLSRSAVYSALFLVLNFATVAVFFLLLNAPFIAIAQVSVYAGAIMVLFLFVIMLLGAEQLGTATALPWQRPVAFVLAGLLVVLGIYALITGSVSPVQAGVVPADFGSPASVGSLLYSTYLLPFEVISVLLLAAMVGAIVLSKKRDRGA